MALFVIATAQLMIVLDATIVYVALPHIQAALGFSGSGLEWVANAYALTFGGLLLLGGRAGDLLGRRRMFIIGLLLFSAASLAGGLGDLPGVAAGGPRRSGRGRRDRRADRAGADRDHLPRGPAAQPGDGRVRRDERGRRVRSGCWPGGCSSRTPTGAGCCSSTCRSASRSRSPARFVLVPVLVPLSAPTGSAGRLDLPGTVTGTAGVAALVYGLSNAATSPDGTSHWGDAKVVVALAAWAVLLAAFAVIESRSRHALLPLRLLRSRDRVGAYLMMLGVGTAIAGVFFFLTLFVQDVWGYSALRTGVAFLPVTAAMLVGAVGASALVPRIGARPLLVGGSAVTVGGLFWLSRMTEHGTYAGDLLGAGLVLGVGFGLLIVPLQLLSLTRVGEADSGVAASLLNAGRQVGGAIGLAVLGTVAWTVVADNAHGHAAGVAVRRCRRRTGTRWRSVSTAPSWSAPGSACSFC